MTNDYQSGRSFENRSSGCGYCEFSNRSYLYKSPSLKYDILQSPGYKSTLKPLDSEIIKPD